MISLQRLKSWLSRPPSRLGAVKLSTAVLVTEVVFSFIANGLVTLATYADPLPTSPMSTTLSGDPMTNSYAFVSLFIAAPVEEMLFRILPLTFSLRRWGLKTPTIIVLLLQAILFGLSHGSVWHILIQGVGGLIYGLLFIKLSDIGKRYLYAGSFVIATHLAFDLFVFTIVVMTGTGW